MIKILFILVIIFILFNMNRNERFTNSFDNLDIKYLEKLLKNHKILIELAELKIKDTDNPDMKYMLNRLILSLDMEIYQIEVALKLLFNIKITDILSNRDFKTIEESWLDYVENLEDFYKIKTIKKNNENNNDDNKFIDIVIEILNYSNNLSKNIIDNNTDNINDFILDRANKTLYFNNKTIFLLNNMKNNKFNNKMII